MAETKPATPVPATPTPIAPQTTTPDPTKPGTAAPATGTTGTPTAGATPVAAAKPTEKQYPSVEDIMFVCPTAKKDTVVKNLPGVIEELAKAGMTSKNLLISVVATIHVECEIDPFNPIEELGGRSQARRNGYGGGENYFGRGYIQLTHDYNYRDAGQAIGLGNQLVDKPELALRADYATKVITWFWKKNGVDKAAEAGDWRQVRKIVNGGYTHYDKFIGAVERGLQRFTGGVKSVGGINMGTSYGASDADAGGGQSRTVIATGATGAQGQGQACVLAYALSLHARDRMNSHEFYAVLDCAADPKILDLEAQKTFELKGLSKDLDGVYTVDEVTFLPLTDTVQAIVKAKRPDPNALEARGFLFDAQGLAPKAGAAAPGTNSTPGQPGSVTKIGGEVKLGVPYKSQLDNAFNPGGSCNATSLAMALEFLGVKGKGSGQFEDEIYEQLLASGLHPGTASAMVAMVEKYGKKDRHTETATDDDIRKHLDKGKPVVIHGDFTRSGHILCVIGYNAKGFIVNDPYGKFLGSLGSYDNNASGAGILHEYATVVKNFWHRKGTNSAHFIE
ncbi:C39 family peptidase [Microcoleus sp. herbarium7]|uniref:C39 family peptidase n=1 Tax=Microcoleus sp. herbarium7 TaxID=3055435 RepID=UPI002FD69973